MPGRSMDTSLQFPGYFGVRDTSFGPQMFERVHGFPPMLHRMPMIFVDGRIPLPILLIGFDRLFGFSPRGYVPLGISET
ncbi:hypothetical protein DPMN_103932 [Dreissena polymorpha]|uniref:Uncharacterized protein n=1 Tax=Dreissena polymorpha TaxID=45954 RepID=A0A9D4H6U5_DREPO|nr:hypothetical protein DPMN_103932 [Dreissena polymorpha]